MAATETRVIRQLQRTITALQQSSVTLGQTKTSELGRLIDFWNGVCQGEQANKHRRLADDSFSLIILDLSNNINQEAAATGRILSIATRALRRRLRKTDVVGRFGQERLVIGLPGADEVSTHALAKELVRELKERAKSLGWQDLEVAYGVASLTGGMAIYSLIQAADQALEQARFQPTTVKRLLTKNPLFTPIVQIRYRNSYQGLVSLMVRLSFLVVGVSQFLVSLLTLFWLKLVMTVEITGAEYLRQISKPFIVVANHKSLLDPQLIGVALLRRPKLYPLNYMAKDELFRYPIFNLMIYLLGAFRANRKRGIDKALLTPLKILSHRGAVSIFPEGKIIPDRTRLGVGRRGAAILALISGAPLVPIALKTPSNLNPWLALTGSVKVSIRIGRPFYLRDTEYLDFSDQLLSNATKKIMRRIASLYFRDRSSPRS